MKVLFYGDSNTWGFDPRDFFGGRYDTYWTELLQKKLGETCRILNEGMNGREIPAGKYDLSLVERRLEKLESRDIFAVMLGTNDLLNSFHPDAEKITEKMEAFIDWFISRPAHPRFLLIAPPYIGGDEKTDHCEPAGSSYYKESVRLNAGYRRLAEKYGLLFADAGEWNVDLAYDGVHFSEEGHETFARKMAGFIKAGYKEND